MRILVTGGAGFIGSALVSSLAMRGHAVTILDNFSTGHNSNLVDVQSQVKLIRGDCTNEKDVSLALEGQEVVFHLAANPEVRKEFNDSQNCFKQNIYASYVLLEGISRSSVKTTVFVSTSTVYGEARVIPTPETYGELKPISYYGASKLASEALISSYCSMHKKHAILLRLANIIGPKSGHGVVFDFIRKLKQNPNKLEVLGDGKQSKSYLHIDDCISGIMTAWLNSTELVDIFNIGSDDKIEVSEIAKIVINEMNPSAEVFYTGGIDGGRGWNGDVKLMQLDSRKIRSLGWKPSFSSAEAIVRTVKEVLHATSTTQIRS